MKKILLREITMSECVSRALEVLGAGGVVLYPTDTLYGLGADAFSDEAVRRVQDIKGRAREKPIHCVAADLTMAERYAYFSEDALLLAREFWPGALTLVLGKKSAVERGIVRGRDAIGIRIPDNKFCLALARAFGKPYTTTSANQAGEESRRNVGEIIEQLGDRAANIDLIIDAGELRESKSSTVVDLSGKEPVILREGAIPAADIWEVIRTEL